MHTSSAESRPAHKPPTPPPGKRRKVAQVTSAPASNLRDASAPGLMPVPRGAGLPVAAAPTPLEASAAPCAAVPKQPSTPKALPANLRFSHRGRLPDFPVLAKGPRNYGAWVEKPGSEAEKPRALILFSGKPRPGNLQQFLATKGWLVCAVDKLAAVKTDVLNEAEWGPIIQDVKDSFFDAVWVATPCGTFCPLRERPRPIRDTEHPSGLPGLSKDEVKRSRPTP